MTHVRLTVESLEHRDLPAAFETLPVLPFGDPTVVDTARAIVARGGGLGRNTDAFMKVGDSNSDPGFGAGYLFPLGAPAYNPVSSGLAAYPGLLDTLAAYRTPAGATNSFARASAVAVAGARASSLLDGLDAEADATGAGIALVMVGTNDVIVGRDLAGFRSDLRELVRRLVGTGVVPVLSTIPDDLAFGGTYTALVPGYNQVIADVAAEFHVPLWNAWRSLSALPNHGLDALGLHLAASPRPGGVGATDLLYGQNLRTLEALQILDWFREQVVAPAPAAVPPLPWVPLAPGEAVVAAGRGEGQAPVVSVYNAAGAEVNRFLAFDPGFAGGVRVATADVTGDGVLDIVAGAGSGGAPVVKVFSGADGAEVASFFAFEPAFRSGVNVAAADLDGDGVAEIVAGAGGGGGPVVTVYHGGDFAEVARFFAYEPSFRGGVYVAAGNVASVGPAIVTGGGAGGGPVVKAFRLGGATPVLSYLAYAPQDRTGVVVAVADLDGDGTGGVVTAPAAAEPHVRVVDPDTGIERSSFFAPGVGFGLDLGVLHVEGRDVLLIGSGTGAGTGTWAFDGAATVPFGPSDPSRTYGVYVG